MLATQSSTICKPIVSAPPIKSKQDIITLKADTGATSTFLDAKDVGKLTVHAPTKTQPSIGALVPSGHIIQSQGHTHLPITNLPSSTTLAHVMPKLASGSLLSVGTVCDANCTAIFDATSVKIYHNEDLCLKATKPPLIQGNRNSPKQPLYTIQLSTSKAPLVPMQASTAPHLHSTSTASVNATIHNPSIRNRVAFYHAALFSPPIATWLNAHKKKNLDSWPAITTSQINKYGPLSKATIQGHRHAHRSNIRSTKSAKTGPLPLTYAAAAANAEEISPDPTHIRTNNVFVDNIDITGRTFSDQTGRFVCPSISGNNYIFILYDYDTNSIHAVAIPNRKKESLLSAMKHITKKLTRRGFKPVLHKMDNEVSDLMREYLDDENINFELTPTGLHRRNLAERAIQTFKNHFISGLCSTHPDFPLNLWDKLLPQCEITLNLLRSSRINPHLSAYAQLHGNFDYNATPLAPPGMKVLVHERPLERGSSWSPHNTEGWYIGPALDHYRQHRVWIPSTGAERIADTVTWLPHHIHMPTSSAEDIIIAAANDLTHALQQTDKSPLLPPVNTQTRSALMRLQQIFTDRFAAPLQPLPSSTLPNTARNVVSPTLEKLPRVMPNTSLPSKASPPAKLPRVNIPSQPTTAREYHDLSTTLKTLRRRKAAVNRKRRSTPSSPSPSPSPPSSLYV